MLESYQQKALMLQASTEEGKVDVQKLEGIYRSLKDFRGRWWSLNLRDVCLTGASSDQTRRHWRFAQVAVPKHCVPPELRCNLLSQSGDNALRFWTPIPEAYACRRCRKKCALHSFKLGQTSKSYKATDMIIMCTSISMCWKR